MSEEEKLKTPEHRLIESIRQWAGQTYIGDDCAVLPGQSLVTSDMLVEGTHFCLELTSLCDLGWKAVAVNLSDIAAMAGRPRHLVVNVGLPENFKASWFRQLYLSIVQCARSYRTVIVGGDMTRAPVLIISITVLGEVHESGCLRRSGARPGDVVAVTGDFGASAAGLWLLQQGNTGFAHCLESHRRPHPRFCEAWALVRRTGNRGALMDASDGLADALAQIARASGVGMRIDLQSVPVHTQTRAAASLAGVDPLTWALYGGEDYELVACIAPDVFAALGNAPDNPFTAIGQVTQHPELHLCSAQGQTIDLDLTRTFQHIREPI